jgi:C-terminal processing protease CtpA/Prc
MKGLAGINSLINDLGHSPGGTTEMVDLISNYFFEDKVHLMRIEKRGMAVPQDRITNGNSEVKDFINIPVYVLTDVRTFSASETFIFGLKSVDIITLIDEPTGDGGHFGDVVDVDEDFLIFVPRGGAFNPKTNMGWEDEGIATHITMEC